MGRLRIYLGAAPGVGKTFAMLSEGVRRATRGTDVVVGVAAGRGREPLESLLGDLEQIGEADTLDVAALIARAPAVALIDDLAHVNAPGSDNAFRWQDVQVLLAAGIDVVTTLNVSQIESLADVVGSIIGRTPTDCVPDSLLRAADQIELVDMAPEALQRRLAHGNVYREDELDVEVSDFFRLGNLAALRELALLWLADRVDEALQRYRVRKGIAERWDARERVVVGLAGRPTDEMLVRRAARIAAGASGADLLAVHVATSADLRMNTPDALVAARRAVETFGGTYHQVVGARAASSLLEFARAESATQVVVGERVRGWFGGLTGTTAALRRDAGDLDLHLVPLPGGRRTLPGWGLAKFGRARTVWSFALSVVLPILLTVVLTHTRTVINRQSDLLLFLLLIVVVSLIGGLWPALVAAGTSFLLVNYWFIPPQYTFRIEGRNSVVAVVVFLLVALLVSAVVDLASRRTREAAIAKAEAETLATVAGSVLRGGTTLDAIFDRFREAFGLTSIALLEAQGSEWVVRVSAGGQAPTSPVGADLDVKVGDRYALVGTGVPTAAHQRQAFVGFAAQAAVAIEAQRLAEEAAVAGELEATDRLRTALLAAVGHDLRTPLAVAKASVNSLRDPDVAWTKEQQDDLLETADSSLDRLARLVYNLLDLSRLQAGVLPVQAEPVDLSDVIALALGEVDESVRVKIRLPQDLPEVDADPILLERVIANLVANAVRHSPPDVPPMLIADVVGSSIQLRVVDRGPGIAPADRDRVFAPFQRLGDTDNTTGVGLGLALSRGLAEAMGATISLTDTPGGGLTAVVTLQRAIALTVPPGLRESDRPTVAP